MKRTMFNGKIHRARVTHADLNYEGSVTIDSTLMEGANILPNEAVHIWNITRGSRLQTYALPGEAGSGLVCVNGAAAHLNQPGDLVIIASFVELDEQEARRHRPHIVRVDDHNRMIGDQAEEPGPHWPSPQWA
jgi:aspartate 1-decarboxylase